MAKRPDKRRYVRTEHPVGGEAAIRFELFNTERLQQHAISLAEAQKQTNLSKGHNLIPRVRENAVVLADAYQAVDAEVRGQHAITPAAEWLLDNFHVIEEQLADIYADLPDSYARELPKLIDGLLAGYPRVYGIAWALVAHTDSRFSPELLQLFVNAYQSVTPLTLGELWAIPITLRVLLIENLRRLAVSILRSQNGRRLADDFVNHIEKIVAHSDRADPPIPAAKLPEDSLRRAYAVQIMQRSHDPHPAVVISLDFLNDWLNQENLTIDQLVHQEHAEQIADNLTVRNIITSMRGISVFDWTQFVEQVSLVDACLRQHDGYLAMDFLTRDRYRHAIEELAKRSVYSEVEIARLALIEVEQAKLQGSADQRQLEPGYYLIGAGRYRFESQVGYRPLVRQKLLRLYIKYSGLAYIGSLLVVNLLLLSLPLIAAHMVGVSQFHLMILALLLLFPAADIAVGIINQIIIAGLPPCHMPRLEFKNGVPEVFSTFVVVPTLLVSEQDVKQQVEQMEIRYLANPDGAVRFALLSDWVDADHENLPKDQVILNLAVNLVNALNQKYAKSLFFIFHRKRLWNPSEGKWMGWERKRGKLHEFNRLLRGATDTTFLAIQGQPAIAPEGVCYVITLDADTKLPMGVVSKLVGVAAHPLNSPVFDCDCQMVTNGYGILQPRVTPTLPHRHERSLYHRIFAGATGTDAYASSVSELYQDLFGLGTYSGKGLYHVDTFEAALAGRVPENTQLSHDLFESVYVRCGLVSDIEFFEEFPSHIDVAASRIHRWVRGDWQLIPWLFGACGKGMPSIGRWKMLDNLRRSLSAPAAFAGFVSIWLIPNTPILLLTAFVLIALSLPTILAIVSAFTSPRRGTSWATHGRGAAENVFWAMANSVVVVILLLQQTWLMIDAILITLVRLFITRRQLLKWVTALQAKSNVAYGFRTLIRPLAQAILTVLIIVSLILIFNPIAMPYAAPLLLLWCLAPMIARQLSLPPKLDKAELLLADDIRQLRLIGRRIWRFFSTFVGAEDHFLPPDNFQEQPIPVLAHRSSPTNFGLYLLSVLAARDFGWLGLMDTLEKLEASLATLLTLPRLNGHFYNWYDTRSLQVLEPRYVSTVDSGNLAGHLLTLSQACRDMLNQPLDFSAALKGLLDSHQLLTIALAKVERHGHRHNAIVKELRQKLPAIGELLKQHPTDEVAWRHVWLQLAEDIKLLRELADAYALEYGKDHELLTWIELFCADIGSHLKDVDSLMPWVAYAGSDDLALLQLPESLSLSTPLGELAQHYGNCVHDADSALGLINQPLIQALQNASNQAQAISQRLQTITTQLDSLFEAMDFGFVYDTDRHMFAIGYQVAEGAIDPSYYDLLASEARLSSFVAIAKRDVPSEHWFHLGRRVTRAANGTVLLSWSGSMFEYLMPSLVTFTPRYSLLDQTCRLIVKRQIEYGQQRGVPWGVSESAFNGRDLNFTYQYSAFGVPGLGMKRGLAEELVIAPYATALAAMYWPHAAVENFVELEKIGALGEFGFYEALDFTPMRLAEGQSVAMVRCYMAHHQGMSLVAFANVVYDGIMRHRFHRTPLIQSAAMLLQERVPHGADTSSLPLLPALAEIKDTVQPPVRRVPSPMSAIPSTHLLSNGRYSVMLTASGSGYSRYQNLAVSRWREDVTRDDWGSYLYLRDVETGYVWSAGYQPTAAIPDDYDVVFIEDRARIVRCDGCISSHLEVVVSPEDDAEIRRLSLTNNGSEPREIEVTSYAEIVLATSAADSAHPAFSNLFIQTEYLPATQALIAHRRQRKPEDTAIWAAHVLADRPVHASLQYETDRARFIGRCQNLRQPAAVSNGLPLTNSVGLVLDPIFSLRSRIKLAPASTEHLTFTTLVATSRQAVIELAEKYHSNSVWERVSALAWTHAHVQLHHLRTKPDEAQLFQILANRLIYADPSLRPSSKLMQTNSLNVSGLWRYGISGDRPIVLLRIADSSDLGMVEQLLRAHEYWRIKGLNADLVIMNEKALSYVEDLKTVLNSMVRENQLRSLAQSHENSGKVFVIQADQLSNDERRLLQTAARVMLVSHHGTLAEQLLRHARPAAAFIAAKSTIVSNQDSPALAIPKLEFFNGLGGFAEQGREYVIVLDKGQSTPAPWINVIANSELGFMVSESGSACTWAENSRQNQLTPWANDPVSDPSGEIFYLRDDESKALWSPTALPIRVENSSYLIRHGFGYSRFEHASHGIHSELLQMVSPDQPIKISSLILTNQTKRLRRLTVTAYVEWVLGASREVTAPYIISELDPETGALFASNPLDLNFAERIAFADLSAQQTAWTMSRSEFIGRNGSLDAPISLLHFKSLHSRVGAGLDTCAAMQQSIELKPNQSFEIVFLLGQGKDRDHARRLIKQFRATATSETLALVKHSWQQVLAKTQVKTPDRQLDILLNGWLLYQTLSCRIWARAGFYQVGGAFGFRDQLQDSMALAVAKPELTRAHLLRAAGRQFAEGDVQHWWHPPTGNGVRTHFADDRIWLPYAVAHYIKVSGDNAVLNEMLAFIDGKALEPDQEDAYFQPTPSTQVASLFEHCARCLDISLATGVHGLPLIGCGDWNDGMNRVGREGKGESVWLAWFLISNLNQFAELAEQIGDSQRAERWRQHAQQLTLALEAEGWDGAWYRRAYFDDGSALGSAANAECRIDAIAQSWAVISKVADPERARMAMASVREYLVRDGDDLLLLFTPPFNKTEHDPGYIKSYPPGIRENGGQYTHAAVWSVIAYAMLGEGEQALELIQMLNPIKRTANRAGVYAYKVEPYVLAADIYAEPPHVRRGGWTWYTGAAGWFYRAGIEFILGLQVRGDRLEFAPCIASHWPSYQITYQHQSSCYQITVENPHRVKGGIVVLELDGVPQVDCRTIQLIDDGKIHQVRIELA